MGNSSNLLTPATVWEGYNPLSGDFDVSVESSEVCREVNITDYRFSAPIGVANVKVALKLYSPACANGRAVMIVEEYHRPPDTAFVEELCCGGYTVLIPDISGVATPATIFPEDYAYGQYEKAGEHLYKLMPTARETCQYLYSVIVKRTLAFAKEFLHLQNPTLVGLGDAVEVAMQVAGSGGEINALACINGSGYREYIKLNKYGNNKELDITDERMCWLSGVASVAYAKNITCNTFIAFGTNSGHGDPDRLTNLVALMPEGNVRICLSCETDNYISAESFKSFRYWLDAVGGGKTLPNLPEAALRVDDDGVPGMMIKCDSSEKIVGIKVFYSYGEYNHTVRRWQMAEAFTVSVGNYISHAESYDVAGALFAFAEVEYESGFRMTSIPDYIDLSGQKVKPSEESLSRILFSPSSEEALTWFTDEYDGIAMLKGGKKIVSTPVGLQGITTDAIGLKTYNLGKAAELDYSGMLQVDVYADKKCEVEFILEVEVNGEVAAYSNTETVLPSQGFFLSEKMNINDFKKCEKDHNIPLVDWRGVRSLTIVGSGIIIGNILFI